MKKIVLLTIVIFLFSIIGYGLSLLIDTGVFADWESLGTPPGGGQKILDSDGFSVFVKTNQDEVYECSMLLNSTCWEKTTWPPSRPLQAAWPIHDDIFWITNQPKSVIDSVAVEGFLFEHKVEVKYVLLADGSVWRWYYAIHGMSVQPLLYICGGGVLGFLVMLLIFVFSPKLPRAH